MTSRPLLGRNAESEVQMAMDEAAARALLGNAV